MQYPCGEAFPDCHISLNPFLLSSSLICFTCSSSLVSHTMRSMQAFIFSLSPLRSWRTLVIFPPHPAMTDATSTRLPGWSSSSTFITLTRPLFASPRFITRWSIVTSIFPPLTTHIVFLPFTGTLLYITAATLAAPAPSATTFSFSSRWSIAPHISSSVTVTIPSTYLLHISYVSVPGSFTAIPSAIVDTDGRISRLCVSRLRTMLAAPAA